MRISRRSSAPDGSARVDGRRAAAGRGGETSPSRPAPSVQGFLRQERGGSAVEFAIIAPVLVALTAGIIVFGLYFGVVHCVQQLASEAARSAVAGITEQERADLARGQVSRSIQYYGLLDPARLTVRAASSPSDPDLFVVTLSYDASRLGLSAFSSLIPVPLAQVERRASIRRGGA